MIWLCVLAYACAGVFVARRIALWMLNDIADDTPDNFDYMMTSMMGLLLALVWPFIVVVWVLRTIWFPAEDQS